MKNIRTWIYRILVLIGAGLMLYTFFQPWWQAYVIALNKYAVSIFPYGMKMDVGDFGQWLAGADEVLPNWFTPFMWVYLGICILALLFSLFASSKKGIKLGKLNISLPSIIIGIVGLSYIIVPVTALIMIALNAPKYFDAPIQGKIYVSVSSFEASWVNTGFDTAYWMAYAVGIFLVLLAVFRNKIIGKG